MQEIKIKTKEGAKKPHYASKGAAGADVCAHIEESVELLPGKRTLIKTGIFFEIPEGLEIQVRPRSGLAAKNGITVLNSPGTIDSDYRGELMIILVNLGDEPFMIEPGMRIAQIVVSRVKQYSFTEEQELTATARGESGFGHTGLY